MQIFVDTGLVEEIREAAKLGIIDGVTTNPSLIAKSGRSLKDVIEEICSIIDGPISAEVIAIEKEAMLLEAAELSKIHDNIVIKLPLTEDGIAACKVLSAQGVKTNVTLCFSSNQAILAAKAGATYISPFIGRLDDNGHDGMALIEEIRAVYDIYGYQTQVLAASVRHATHIRDCGLVGADVITAPLKAIKLMYKHPLTENGLKAFLSDYAKSAK
ncbi:MAG: fructose-6-phosphate aldolase [Bacteriovoracaceae bacterium]|jgi:transaldolase|nr:fructose-6-phosphate aldolase [Bacteriovoracaceae bacterium]